MSLISGQIKYMQAILLAAGRGSRLKHITEGRPKPFVYLEVNQRPLIEHTLDHLHSLGISEVIILVGYLQEYIREHLGEKYKSVNIRYVEVPDWETTNNASGLLYARPFVTGPFVLLEADEFFLYPFFTKEHLADEKNYWVGTRQPITGCLLFPSNEGRIQDLDIVRDANALSSLPTYYKSCGVVKISAPHVSLFFERLEKFVDTHPDNKKKYFDLCLKENLANLPIHLHPLSEQNTWAEVDSEEDLNDIHTVLLSQYAQERIDKEERDNYWKNFYLHKSVDDLLYHVSGADKDISTSGYSLKPSSYLHYLYRFCYEEKLIKFFLRRFVRTFNWALDVACGTGRNSVLLAHFFGNVDAFDISESFIEENKKRFARYKNISFFTDNVNQPMLSNKKYDLIFLGGICMYLSDEEMTAFLKQVRALLNAGGVVLARDSVSPNPTSFYSHIKVYRNEKDYENILTQNGFEVLQKYNGPNRNLWCSLFQKLPLSWQETGVIKKIFVAGIKMTILVDVLLARKRPFARHSLTNQLFYILKPRV